MWVNAYEEMVQLVANLKEFDSTFTKEKVKICNINDNGKICAKKRESVDNEKQYLAMDKIVMKITRIDSWNKMLDKIKDYINEKKCRPSDKSHEMNIKIMGKWISHQQENAKKRTKSMKLQDVYDKWAAFTNEYRAYFRTNKEQWNDMMDKVIEYINSNKCKPSRDSKDDDIKTMGAWVNTQLMNAKERSNIMGDEEIHKKWIDFLCQYSIYFQTNKEQWIIMLDKIRAYIDINQCKPNSNSSDPNTKEMGKWVIYQQKISKNRSGIMKENCIHGFWTDFINQHEEYFLTEEEKWNRMLCKIKVFIDNNKCRPLERSEDNEEKKMGKWLSTQQQNSKKKINVMKFRAINNSWVDFVSQYEEYFRTTEEQWNIMCDKVNKYISINKCLPSHCSKNNEIKIMWSWIQCQKNNAKGRINALKSDNTYDKWLELTKKHDCYFRTNEEQWDLMMDNVKKHIDTYCCKPSTHSIDIEVKKMGRWICCQQKNFIKRTQIMKDECTYKKWEAFINQYEEYFRTNEEQWDIMLEKITKYIVKYECKPSRSADDIDIKKMGLWLNKQKQNERNKTQIMQNEDIRKKWILFVEQYEKYF